MKTNEFKHHHLKHILFITEKIMQERKRSDKVFEEFFRLNSILKDSDRDFIVQYVYYLIRNWRLFREINLKGSVEPNEINGILEISLLLAGLPWSKRIDRKKILGIYNELLNERAVFNSVPDWIDQTGMKELGNHWPEILYSLNQSPRFVIRANTLKISRDALVRRINSHGIQTSVHSEAPDALILENKTNVFRLPEFQEGLFEMQDISSQITGLFTRVEPGMRVVDGCAGNGGKTLHLAGMMKNKGKIIALDIYGAKLQNLKRRAKRAGAGIIETREVESAKTIKRLRDSADLVLLDVPCSGLGVLKRNPEIKWNLKPADLENLNKIQEDILYRYSQMVKPGGRLVYSTCSILPRENSGQIKNFLQKTPEFEFMGERFISPCEGFDGFYMASLKRLS